VEHLCLYLDLFRTDGYTWSWRWLHSVLDLQAIRTTLYSLRPISESSTFDFLPYDVMYKRAANGNYHLGDLTFRVRTVGSIDWIQGDTSTNRQNVTVLPISGSTISASDLAPTLQNNSLLSVVRRWAIENDQLELIFDVTNPQSTAVEIGAIGAPLEFNNVSTRLAV
jgi:hypothetical protein